MAKKEETKIRIEREYTIPLREKCRPAPRYKKTNKAIKTIKEFLVKHMKIYDRDLNKIKIDKYLNEAIWSRGIKNPPSKIKVKAIKEGDEVFVTAIEIPSKINFKKIRSERIEKNAEEIKEKKKNIMQKAQENIEKTKEVKDEEKAEERAEEKEKSAAVQEAGEKLAKTQAREMKHLAKTNSKEPKRPVRQVLNK